MIKKLLLILAIAPLLMQATPCSSKNPTARNVPRMLETNQVDNDNDSPIIEQREMPAEMNSIVTDDASTTNRG